MGLYSWRSWTLRGKSFAYARKLPQKSAQKKEFSETIKRRASIAGGHPAGHYVAIVRGEVCETGHIKKAESGEYKKEYPPSLWLLGICPGDRRGEGFPTLAGFVVKGGYFTQCRFPLQKEKGRGTMSTTR